jgi:fibro-slime domain-containing protein
VVQQYWSRAVEFGIGLVLSGVLAGCGANSGSSQVTSRPTGAAGSDTAGSAGSGASASGGTSSDINTSNGGGGAGGSDCAGSAGCGMSMKKPICGDGVLDPGEACDDGNTVAGDGCIATCQQVEANFVCPTPGQACVSTIKCGDGKIAGDEQCDDKNSRNNDGCSSTCQIEPGWSCPIQGDRCVATKCGDGIIAGNEQCEDGNPTPMGGDGCDANCQIEPGWVCDTAGMPCRKAVCGDGKAEGGEPCDDGNQVVGDGCSPFCEVEPSCPATGGACSSRCGDGLILPTDSEECDDGNTTSGDGCSADCKIEPGYTCTLVSSALPDTLPVPVTFRDQISLACPSDSTVGGYSAASCKAGVTSTRNPDFQAHFGSRVYDLVGNTLGADGKPTYTGVCELPASCTINSGPTPDFDNRETCPAGVNPPASCDGSWWPMHGATSFHAWYNDTPGTNIDIVSQFNMIAQGGGVYHYPATAGAPLFPIDGKGWVGAGSEATYNGHNYGFTTEVRYWFQFAGGEALTFSGDDDVWVFVNGKLAIDLGGLHGRIQSTLHLDGTTGNGSCTEPDAMGVDQPCATPTRTLGLQVGEIYEIALFHAERHLSASNFDLTLGGFLHAKSTCQSVCGDGIVTPDEDCDDGTNNGKGYGYCTTMCTRGSYCGDGTVDMPFEQCDDGVNLSQYGGCAPGCVLGPKCGDGIVQSKFEECDDGTNLGGYGKCAPGCALGPRCGDGVIQGSEGEECDDGNNTPNDGCSPDCEIEVK